ncbi:MAG TPA: ATP-binding protein [Alphaproteobacteria bacterium]|nr:ATP-binding protein [Alphaproteobacteria bacterium]
MPLSQPRVVADRTRIARDLADIVYASPWPTLVMVIVAAFTTAVLWHAVEPAAIAAWMAAVLAFSGVRVALWRAYRTARAAGKAVEHWPRRFAMAMLALGCLWGALAAVLALSDDVLLHAYVCIAAAGLAAGAVCTYPAHVPAVDLFIWPMLVPLAAAAAWWGDAAYLALACLTLVFAAALSLLARRAHRNIVAALETKHEKEALAQALIIARDEAEMASRAKSEFLATMSHELRTPLNAIIGFAEIMRDELFGPLGSPRYAAYARDIHGSGRHLLSLINDILDLSKIEAGRFTLAEEAVDVAAVVRGSAHVLAERAQAGGLDLALELPERPPMLRADARALQQVLLNLITNAVKFTEAGGRVTVRADLAPAGGLVISVADTGIGIAPADLARALEPFGQIETAANRRHQGTGLGLPLAKKLVEAHGGTFTIASEPGVGTVASALFPADRVLAA